MAFIFTLVKGQIYLAQTNAHDGESGNPIQTLEGGGLRLESSMLMTIASAIKVRVLGLAGFPLPHSHNFTGFVAEGKAQFPHPLPKALV